MTRTRSTDSSDRSESNVDRIPRRDRSREDDLADRRAEVPDNARERFNKALRKKEGEESRDRQLAGREKKDPSLFDLSGKKAGDALGALQKKPGQMEEELSEGEGKGLLTSEEEMLMGGEEAARQAAALQAKHQAEMAASSGSSAVKEDAKTSAAKKGLAALEAEKKETAVLSQKAENAAFTIEKGAAQSGVAFGEVKGATPIPKTDLQAIVKQIADRLAIVKAGDKVDTQVTLRHPPSFEGATITVTEHATSQGQFNLSFANLNNQAKAMLDLMANQDALKQALENKGFVVHIINTSIERENLVATETQREPGRDRGQGQQQQDQQQEGREQRR